MVMACLNIISFLTHIDSLRVFTSQKIVVLAINETKLDSSIRDTDVCLHGFEIIRRNLETKGRNVGLYVSILAQILTKLM